MNFSRIFLTFSIQFLPLELEIINYCYTRVFICRSKICKLICLQFVSSRQTCSLLSENGCNFDEISVQRSCQHIIPPKFVSDLNLSSWLWFALPLQRASANTNEADCQVQCRNFVFIRFGFAFGNTPYFFFVFFRCDIFVLLSRRR